VNALTAADWALVNARVLGVFGPVLIATGMAHRFWEYEPAQRVNQINHFLKNLALIGAMLYIVVGGPGSASVDKS